jgi:hypothetical protein
MSSKIDPSPSDRASTSGFWLALLLVVAVAIAVRAPNLGEWSLWEDEETSLHFSQQLHKPFPATFPIFFASLRGVYEVTGVSVFAGRVYAATLGVLSVALVYVGFARLWSRQVAVLAALFVALSFGHLFWSQSVRYYILLFVFQMLSLYWFLDGFERDRPRELVLANVALALGLWTHFSGALLMPVFVGYLILMLLRRESGAGYNLRGYLAFGVPFLLLSAVFAWQFLRFRTSLASLVTGATNPIRILLQVVIYFGPLTVALGLLAPIVARNAWRDRRLIFLLITAIIPILELGVIAVLNLTIVTWYYAFFALVGFAGLAAVTLVSLAERGYRRAAMGAGAVALLSAVPLLLAYHLVLFGDRPRWKEATAVLRTEAKLDVAARDNPAVFANVPGIVAFYLGVPPAETMTNTLVLKIPQSPPEKDPAAEQWYLVEASAIPPAVAAWLESRCAKVHQVEARSGPKDRTLTIYHYRPQGSANASSSLKD